MKVCGLQHKKYHSTEKFLIKLFISVHT